MFLLEGHHKFECGVPDIYGTILDKMQALSQGKLNSGDTGEYSRLALRAITRYPLAWHYKQKEIKNQSNVNSSNVTSSHGIWNLVTHEEKVSETRMWWFLISAVCNLRALQLSGYFGKSKVRLGKVLEEKEKMVGAMLVDLLLSMQFNTHGVTESKDGCQQPQSVRKLFDNSIR